MKPTPTSCQRCGHREATTVCRYCKTDKINAAARAARGSSLLLPVPGPDAAAPDVKKQARAVLAAVRALIDAVRDAGPGGIPSGALYAALMGVLTLEQYERLLGLAVGSGVIESKNHLLVYKGAS
jgi:hypothetical protein